MSTNNQSYLIENLTYYFYKIIIIKIIIFSISISFFLFIANGQLYFLIYFISNVRTITFDTTLSRLVHVTSCEQRNFGLRWTHNFYLTQLAHLTNGSKNYSLSIFVFLMGELTYVPKKQTSLFHRLKINDKVIITMTIGVPLV